MRSFFTWLLWLLLINGWAVLFFFYIWQPRIIIGVACGLITIGRLLYVFVGKYSVITNFLIATFVISGLIVLLYPTYPFTIDELSEKTTEIYTENGVIQASLLSDFKTYDVKSRLVVQWKAWSTNYSIKSVDWLDVLQEDVVSYASPSEDGQDIKLSLVEWVSLNMAPQSQLKINTYTWTNTFPWWKWVIVRTPYQWHIAYENLWHIFSAKQYRIQLPWWSLIVWEWAGDVFITGEKVVVTPYVWIWLYIEKKTWKRVFFQPWRAYLIDGKTIKTKKDNVQKDAQTFRSNQQARQKNINEQIQDSLWWRLGSSEILQKISLLKTKYRKYIEPDTDDNALRFYMNHVWFNVPIEDEERIPPQWIYAGYTVDRFGALFDSSISFLAYQYAQSVEPEKQKEIAQKLEKLITQ